MTNEKNSALILIVITVILVFYTLIGIRLYLYKREKLANDIKDKPSNGLIITTLFVVVIIAVFLAPGCLLGYLMNDIKLVKNIGPSGRFFVFLGWIAPGVIFNFIYLIRKIR